MDKSSRFNHSSDAILEAYRLLESIHSDHNVKINKWEVPYLRGEVTLYDYSLDCRGDQEDRLFTRDPYYRNNVRRGNTVIQVIDKQTNELKTTFFGRKGLKKFFDIREEYLDLNLQEINEREFQEKFKEKLEKNSFFSISEHFKLSKMIFSNIRAAYADNEEIEIFKLLKANGENCQIAWIENSHSWLISSKNVSMLVRDSDDIDLYQKDRFYYAKLIAKTWFEILEKIESKGSDLTALKYFLKKHTMIGEYVGNPDCQHLIQYQEIDILFFAIVNNHIDDECIPPLEAFKFFSQFHLNTVRIEDMGTFKTFEGFNQALKLVSTKIASADIELEQEGCVLYFLNTKSQKVVSLGKFKTLEYKIFRKLREKLKNFINFYDNLKFEPFQSFYNEVEELCRFVKPPRPLDFYYKICQFSIDFIEEFPKECDKIHKKFITFLSNALHSIVTKIPLNPRNFAEELARKPWSNYPSDSILKYQFKNSSKTYIKSNENSQRNSKNSINSINSINSTNQQKKKLFIIIPIMLPGAGKSFFIPYLHESLITEKLGSWEAISADKIRRECMNYLSQKNEFLSEEKLFEQTGKPANNKLTKTLEFHIRNIRNSTKENNFLFIDKNHPPSSFEKVIENARKMCSKNIDLKVVALYPECKEGFSSIDGKYKYPFSLNYFFTCLYRVQSRTEHETLKGKHEKSANVMIMYLQLFRDCVLNEEELKGKGFDFAIKVDLTAENNEKIYDKNLVNLLLKILEQTEIKKKCENFDLIQEFSKYFEELNLEFPVLTKQYLIETAKKCIKNCLKLSDSSTELALKRKASKEINLKEELTEKFEEGQVINIFRKNTQENSNMIKTTVFEKYVEEEKIEPSTMDKLHEYNPRVIPTILGIFSIDNQKAKPEILQFIRANLTYLKGEYPEDKLVAQNLLSLTKTFSFPRTLHVTTLVVNNDKNKIESKYYKTFEEGLKIKMEFEVLLYIPDIILAGLYFTKTELPLFDINYPHMTLMIGGCGPEFASKALRFLFEGKGPLKENYEKKSFLKQDFFSFKGEIVVDKKRYIAYLVKIENGVVIDGETAGSVDIKGGK